LFSTTKMNGSLWIAAKFRPSWTSPWLLLPSPIDVIATWPVLRILAPGDPRPRAAAAVATATTPTRGCARASRSDRHLAAAETGRWRRVLAVKDVAGAHPEREARRDRRVERAIQSLPFSSGPRDPDLRALMTLARK
jgi:hypothetical protein